MARTWRGTAREPRRRAGPLVAAFATSITRDPDLLDVTLHVSHDATAPTAKATAASVSIKHAATTAAAATMPTAPLARTAGSSAAAAVSPANETVHTTEIVHTTAHHP
ncbi:MAG: hypothetical protein ACHQ4H_12965 [Ktedonobacterales bacterium]